MALNSLDAVKRRIQALQQQADEAEDRTQLFQRELDEERDAREKVSAFFYFLAARDSQTNRFRQNRSERIGSLFKQWI